MCFLLGGTPPGGVIFWDFYLPLFRRGGYTIFFFYFVPKFGNQHPPSISPASLPPHPSQPLLVIKLSTPRNMTCHISSPLHPPPYLPPSPPLYSSQFPCLLPLNPTISLPLSPPIPLLHTLAVSSLKNSFKLIKTVSN